MTLRLAVDVDGVVADIASAYRQVAETLFGPATSPPAARSPWRTGSEWNAAAERVSAALQGLSIEQRDEVWRRIKQTPDFWTTLRPLETGVISRLNRLAIQYQWNVVFVTQRPGTLGDSVQRQTQLWLVEHGFELPSVIAVAGPRGRLAAELRLDVLVDDLIENCEEAIVVSRVTPLLLSGGGDSAVSARAKALGITVVQSFNECLDILEQLELPEGRSTTRLRDADRQPTGWGARATPMTPHLVERVKRRLGFG